MSSLERVLGDPSSGAYEVGKILLEAEKDKNHPQHNEVVAIFKEYVNCHRPVEGRLDEHLFNVYPQRKQMLISAVARMDYHGFVQDDTINKYREITWGGFKHLARYIDGDFEPYFSTFFEKNETNQALLQQMIKYFTGSRDLGTETIRFIVDKKLNKEGLVRAFAPSREVLLPAYETYDAFEKKLLESIAV